MPADADAPMALKDVFNADRYREIADVIARHVPDFDRQRFLTITLTGLDERELMARLRQTAHAAAASLPGALTEQIAALRRVAADETASFAGIWYSEFVGLYGLDEPALALPALRFFTRFGSAEFAVRGFIARDPTGTLAVMREWASDPDPHVRRLASEGSRPRLPWGARLDFLVRDPSPTRGILEALRNDPSQYVRKSVANHLNDITKDHPEYVIALARAWNREVSGTRWIVRHGLRTLIKRGHPDALALVGAKPGAQVDVRQFLASPTTVPWGGSCLLTLEVQSTDTEPQKLIIDYVVHFARAGARTAVKVFKWRTLTLAAGAVLYLDKRHGFSDLSTRRHHPGSHRFEVQINGQRLAEATVELELSH